MVAVTYYIDEELREAIRIKSLRDGVSRSSLVNKILKIYFNNLNEVRREIANV